METTTLWDLLTEPRISLHLPRFALFLFLAISFEIGCSLKRVQLKCTIPTLTLQVLTGIGGIIATYFMVNATFHAGDRVPIPFWYYPVMIIGLAIPSVFFIRGAKALLKEKHRKNCIVRCLIYALTAYFSITTIATPHKINHLLEKMDNERQVEIRYYGTFSGYNIPLKLSEELTQPEALRRKSYYVGFYNETQSLFRVEKYLNGSLFFQHNYFYHENGSIRENRIVNSDGITTTNHFDAKGKQIKAKGHE